MTQDQTEPLSMYCLKCGYELVGLSKNRCPECGCPFSPEDALSFSLYPRGYLLRQWARRVARGIPLVLLITFWCMYFGLSSTDIRLDTGDLRYRILGIPVYLERMPEPQRTELLQLAQRSSTLKSDWGWLAPQGTSNSPEAMCRRFYYEVAAWADEDPAIAVMIIEDVASYIQRTHASEGAPDSSLLMFCVERGPSGALFVPQNWREYPYAQQYFALKNRAKQ